MIFQGEAEKGQLKIYGLAQFRQYLQDNPGRVEIEIRQVETHDMERYYKRHMLPLIQQAMKKDGNIYDQEQIDVYLRSRTKAENTADHIMLVKIWAAETLNLEL